MIDVIWTLQHLLPSPQFGGCIEYERPIQDENGVNTGEFYTFTEAEIQAQYNGLRWEDERVKPSWDDLIAAWPTAQSTINPLEQLKELFKNLPVEVRASFSPIRSQVLAALNENDFELALYLINQVSVPTELQATKDQMITLIESMENAQ